MKNSDEIYEALFKVVVFIFTIFIVWIVIDSALKFFDGITYPY